MCIPDSNINCKHVLAGPVHHTFDVTVNGVRGLSVFSNTVWGEADCFVQYHFPSAAEDDTEEEQSGELIFSSYDYML